jgi:hypothetical protein
MPLGVHYFSSFEFYGSKLFYVKLFFSFCDFNFSASVENIDANT